MRKRILSIVVALAVLCGLILVIPASASPVTSVTAWNWVDYITDSSYVDNTQYLTVELPLRDLTQALNPSWDYKRGDGSREITVNYLYSTQELQFPYTSTSQYGIKLFYMPFGYQNGNLSRTPLYVENLPDFTDITFNVDFFPLDYRPMYTTDSGNAILTVNYLQIVDNDGSATITTLNSVSSEFFIDDALEDGQEIQIEFFFTLKKPTGCNYIDVTVDFPTLYWGDAPNDGDLFSIRPSPVCMNIEIAALQEIQDSIAGTNDKLDSILDQINKPADPVTPSGSGSIDDIGSAEDGLRDQISGGQSSVGDIQNSAGDALAHFPGAFLFMSKLIDHYVTELTYTDYLIYISLSLGSVAVILGIVPSIIRRSRRDD